MGVADISFMAELCRGPAAAGYPALAFKFDSERLPAVGQTFRALPMPLIDGRRPQQALFRRNLRLNRDH